MKHHLINDLIFFFKFDMESNAWKALVWKNK